MVTLKGSHNVSCWVEDQSISVRSPTPFILAATPRAYNVQAGSRTVTLATTGLLPYESSRSTSQKLLEVCHGAGAETLIDTSLTALRVSSRSVSHNAPRNTFVKN
jgi:hypothetical protein